MSITLGGQTFTNQQIIDAIAASDNIGTTIQTTRSLEEMNGVLEAALHRIAALEDRLPITHAGFGVTKTVNGSIASYRVQVLDHNGQTMYITFELTE